MTRDRTRQTNEPPADLLGTENEGTLVGAEPSAGPLAATGPALAHLATVSAILAILAAIPYLSPVLVRWRVWVAGEGAPIVRMFTREEPVENGMAIATGGARNQAATRRQVAAELGEGVAANLELDEPAPRGEPPPEEPREQAGPAVRIRPEELEGLVRELEDPSGHAMDHFYEALYRTARREAGAITRVAQYGDSSIAGDGITSTLRRRFQQRFGDAGHGFVLIARGTMPYRHADVRHDANDAWRLIELVRGGLRDDLYGYGGVQYRSSHGATARFGTSDRGPVGRAVSRFELWFQRHERGGRIDLRVDSGERAVLETRGDAVEDAWHVVEVPDGEHRLELRTAGGGESRLYGMVLEREGPGVVYDSLGMVGARGRRMLGIDAAHFARQHAHRGTNLIVLGFGGNEADDPSTERLDDDYRRLARLVRRARPEAACLFMAPLDQAERDERGEVRTLRPVPAIVEAQRRAAAAEGCAFFDTFAAMGGEGSMRRWFRTNPRLAFGDYRHATPAGYTVIGNMLYKALLKGFADWLEQREGR